MSRQSGNFDDQCYELLKQVPEGRVTTYAEIARAINSKASRAVGNAMARNKNLFVIPCHRVVRSDGEVGKYALGSEEKAELLKQEGVKVANGKVTDLEKYLYRFVS